MTRLFWLSVLGALTFGACAENLPAFSPRLSAKEDAGAEFKPQADGFTFSQSAKSDWNIDLYESFAVKAGELYVLSCDLAGSVGRTELSAILWRDDGKVFDWNYGSARIEPGKTTSCRFVVPSGVVKVQPRMTGRGSVAMRVSKFTLKRERTLTPDAGMPASCVLESPVTKVEIGLSDGSFALTDKRNGRVNRTFEDKPRVMVLGVQKSAEDGLKPAKSAAVRYVDLASATEFTATYTLDDDGRELLVTIDGNGELTRGLDFPLPFETTKGESLIVPENEGMRFPVNEDHESLWRLPTYMGHGLCMSFFGVCDDASGAGWMCIIETADDGAMNTVREPKSNCWCICPSWDSQRGQFGYARKVRYVLLDHGGYIAMAKRYRAYVKQCGRLVTFREKARERPAIDKLLGAANIWCWRCKGDDASKIVRSMQGVGIDRILWSAGGPPEPMLAPPEFLMAMTNEAKVIAGCYDNYQDVVDYALKGVLKDWHSEWVSDAFPHDINWAGPSPEQWRRGWPLGTFTNCAVICDCRALPYARKRMSNDLATKHTFQARFIDTTTATPWYECWNPAHPMTRTDSRVWKMRLLELVSKDFGFVCGCETGHDAAVPYCDYFEGMLSIGPYRIPDSGRNMWRIEDEVPARTAKYQVGEKYRLPLWELVYHDCCVAQWYWGDYNNKLPKIWHKRDLFNALYGTPPMYMFSVNEWDKLKDRVAESYRLAAPVARLSAYSEMIDHKSLTADYSVQRTRFANGTTVTVNFGSRPFKLEDGSTLAPASARW